MARKLNEFPKDKAEAKTQYPWERWLDGNVWKITKDDDFEIQLDTFMSKVYFEASERDLIVRVKLQDTSVIVQAYTPDQLKAKRAKKSNARAAKAKPTTIARKARVILSDEEVKELKKMRTMGYSLDEIARHFDVSVATVVNKVRV